MPTTITPRIEWTRFFPQADIPDGPASELTVEAATLKAVEDAGCKTIASVRDLLAAPADPDGAKGLGGRRRQELALALAIRDGQAASASLVQTTARSVEWVNEASQIVDKRFGPDARFHSLVVLTHEPSGRKVIRIRWGCLTSWQGQLKQCKREDPHFHACPRRHAGGADQAVEVIED
jgi:hypothetical protein